MVPLVSKLFLIFSWLIFSHSQPGIPFNHQPQAVVKNAVVTSSAPIYDYKVDKSNDGLHISWQTEDESQLVGFYLYRRVAGQAEFTKIAEEMIMAQNPGSVMGAQYEWIDAPPVNQQSAEYRLDVVTVQEVSSVTTHYDPLPWKAFIPVLKH